MAPCNNPLLWSCPSPRCAFLVALVTAEEGGCWQVTGVWASCHGQGVGEATHNKSRTNKPQRDLVRSVPIPDVEDICPPLWNVTKCLRSNAP
jgi:hypothetical protein